MALSHNKLLTQMAIYSSRLYASLEPYSPNRRMVNRLGTLEVAISSDRMADLVRLHGESLELRHRAEILTPARAAEVLPYLDPSRWWEGCWWPRARLWPGPTSAGLSSGRRRPGAELAGPGTPRRSTSTYRREGAGGDDLQPRPSPPRVRLRGDRHQHLGAAPRRPARACRYR